MKRAYLYLLALVILGLSFFAGAQTCTTNPDKYNLRGDGTTLNTAAIQRYIDAVSHQDLQCVVWFRAGVYKTGSLFLKSGVHMRIDKGVTLLGSQNIADYPERPTRVAGIEMTWPSALINVYEQHDVAITGAGLIDGDGKVFWDSYWTLRKAMEPRGLRWASDYDAKRPRLIQVFKSSSVQLGGGLQLQRAGFWTVHICYSHDVKVDGVIIQNNIGGRGPSTDGIDIDSSNHIEVAHADIAVNDDALCLKAGRGFDGLRVNRPTTDIRIHDSTIRDGAAGITFGSETSGGFRNIEAWNIHTMGHVPVGILFKSAHTRGGFAEGVRLHDFNIENASAVLRITMNWNPSYSYASIPAGLTNYPPYYKTLTSPVLPESKGHAHVQDVRVWNIKATNAKTAFEVEAYPDLPLKDFQLEHWDIQAASAGYVFDAKNWHFTNVALHTTDNSVLGVANVSEFTGISTKPADRKQLPDPAKKPSTQQDKS